MPKIRFTETRVVQDGSGTTFEAGKVYDLPPASADRWIRRGVATPVSDRAHAAEPSRVDRLGEAVPPAPVTPEAAKATAQAAAAAAEAKRKAEAEARAAAEQKERERAAAEAAEADAKRTAARAAVQLTDEPVRNKDEAAAAVQAELKRRGR